MHDGNTINVVIQGNGHTILMPVNTFPIEGEQADEMKKWGVDSSLGKSLMDGLSDRYRVVAFDYEAHVLSYAKPETLIPENIARDFLAIADATDTDKFAYYGYSWLALSGMQLAIRTNRLLALVMGGFPPIDGPYREMLTVTQTTHKMSSSYRALEHFNDRKVQDKITCPRLCFAGSDDIIDYGSRWGEVVVNIAEALKNNRQELEAIGWDVEVLEGLDHTGAMQSDNVLSILRPWLDSNLKIK